MILKIMPSMVTDRNVDDTYPRCCTLAATGRILSLGATWSTSRVCSGHYQHHQLEMLELPLDIAKSYFDNVQVHS